MGKVATTATVVVIPAEGDSPDTEQWYIENLQKHYESRLDIFETLVYEHADDLLIDFGIKEGILRFCSEHGFKQAEIHAQGGLGAAVAVQMLEMFPERFRSVFFIGGAPCIAMTPIAKFFHRVCAPVWYHLPIPFFADDPNPHHLPVIDAIKASSTATMQRNPELYRNQLMYIGQWEPSIGWRVPRRVEAYFVPNGETVRPSWLDNTYDNRRAQTAWRCYGVETTARPGDNFSFYSMMPAEALFQVMDQVRFL